MKYLFLLFRLFDKLSWFEALIILLLKYVFLNLIRIVIS